MRRFGLVLALALLAAPAPAQAYMGPGLGMGAIGVALGIVGSLLLGLVSVIWYPFKRLLRRFRRKTPRRSENEPQE